MNMYMHIQCMYMKCEMKNKTSLGVRRNIMKACLGYECGFPQKLYPSSLRLCVYAFMGGANGQGTRQSP